MSVVGYIWKNSSYFKNVFVVLKIECRALHIPGKHLSTQLCHQPSFLKKTFETGSPYMGKGISSCLSFLSSLITCLYHEALSKIVLLWIGEKGVHQLEKKDPGVRE